MTPTLRRFHPDDALPTREVFVAAVEIGAAERYSLAERQEWLPDPDMPADWGTWLAGHTTFVAEEAGRITGFFMIEASGYLNMAFVRPEARGDGTADALYAATLQAARDMGLQRLFVLASRYAESFFRRHGWQDDPDFRDHKGPRMNVPMSLVLTP